jgi:putative transposase
MIEIREYTWQFLGMLAEAGIESVKLPPRAPNLNDCAERFVRTIKESCLERMIFFGEDAYARRCMNCLHLERNHQGLGNGLIVPIAAMDRPGTIERHQKAGWTLELLLPRSGVSRKDGHSVQSAN